MFMLLINGSMRQGAEMTTSEGKSLGREQGGWRAEVLCHSAASARNASASWWRVACPSR